MRTTAVCYVVLLLPSLARASKATCTYGTPPPVVDCVVSDWVATHPCDGKMVTQILVRTITTPAANSGKACPTELTKEESCPPVNCTVSEWGDWELCQEDDTKTRHRFVTGEPFNDGAACPLLDDRRKCDANDCLASKWSDLVCDEDSGFKARSRSVVRSPGPGGLACPATKETSTTPCDPVDCVIQSKQVCTLAPNPNKYSVYVKSTATEVSTPPKHSGKACPAFTPLVQTAERCWCLTSDPSYDQCVAALAKATPVVEGLASNYFAIGAQPVGIPLWECIDRCANLAGCTSILYNRVAQGASGSNWCALVSRLSGTIQSIPEYVAAVMLNPKPVATLPPV